ncbi:MAG: hypothetical protein AUI63_01040 [Gemmatimonadetes bacterium 13_1_40CM_2_60_3]|nr:MAG: hypothetical protein AUI63_01040 [Gemmatimonadetes bacterium 13_1_40CM_2_60_3]
MLEPQLFRGKFLSLPARNRNRGSLRRPNNLEIARSDFDVACLHLRVRHLRRTRGNVPIDRNNGLETKLAGALDHCSRCPLWVERNLNQPGPVTKIEENDPAQVSSAVYPAAEFDFGPDVGRSELSAQMSALGRREAGSRRRGGQRRDVWVE